MTRHQLMALSNCDGIAQGPYTVTVAKEKNRTPILRATRRTLQSTVYNSVVSDTKSAVEIFDLSEVIWIFKRSYLKYFILIPEISLVSSSTSGSRRVFSVDISECFRCCSNKSATLRRIAWDERVLRLIVVGVFSPSTNLVDFPIRREKRRKWRGTFSAKRTTARITSYQRRSSFDTLPPVLSSRNFSRHSKERHPGPFQAF